MRNPTTADIVTEARSFFFDQIGRPRPAATLTRNICSIQEWNLGYFFDTYDCHGSSEVQCKPLGFTFESQILNIACGVAARRAKPQTLNPEP